jgi:hypothetical protein
VQESAWAYTSANPTAYSQFDGPHGRSVIAVSGCCGTCIIHAVEADVR